VQRRRLAAAASGGGYVRRRGHAGHPLWQLPVAMSAAADTRATPLWQRRLLESARASYRTLRTRERPDAERKERQWADVEFIPEWRRNRKRRGETLRYAIRVRRAPDD